MSKTGFGYCACGCGGKTTIPTKNAFTKGHLKGVPLKFMYGHHSRGKTGPQCHNWKAPEEYATHVGGHGYKMVLIHGHHRASLRGYVREHIIVAEKILEKPFKLPHCVHHHAQEQLVLCENQDYHMLLHKRERAYRACGQANCLKCSYCQVYDDPINLNKRGNHKKCHSMAVAKRKKNTQSQHTHKTSPELQ